MQFRCALALAALASAEAQSQDGIVTDVIASLKAIPKCNRLYAGDANLQYMTIVGSGLDEPHKMKGHFQGLARAFNSNYIYATSSASTSGDIFPIEFAGGPNDNALVGMTGVVKGRITVDPVQHHAGGAAIFEDFLVVATEAGDKSLGGYPQGWYNSTVHFFKLDNKDNPTRQSYSIVRIGDGYLGINPAGKGVSAGAVGLTSLASGKYLLGVGEWGNNPVRFYLSTTTSMDDPQFTEVAKLDKINMTTSGEGAGVAYGDYQGFNLVRQVDGKLFMIATHSLSNEVLEFTGYGTDAIDILELTMDGDTPTGWMMVLRKEMSCSGYGNFRNGAGIFVPGGSSVLEMAAYSIDRNTAGDGVYLNEYWVNAECEKFTGGTCSVTDCAESRNAVCNYVGVNECKCADGMCAEGGKCVAAQVTYNQCSKPAVWPAGYTPAFCSAGDKCSVQDLDNYQVACKLSAVGKATVLCTANDGTFELSGCTDASACSKTRPDEADCGTNECALLGTCMDTSQKPTCDVLSRAGTTYSCPPTRNRKNASAAVAVDSCDSSATKDAYDSCIADLCCDETEPVDGAIGLRLGSFIEFACMFIALHACTYGIA